MKKLITEIVRTDINISDLKGDEIVAYKSANGGHYVVLHKIQQDLYGFFNLQYSTSGPTFTGITWYNAVTNASRHRQLYVFASSDDLIDCMYKKKF